MGRGRILRLYLKRSPSRKNYTSSMRGITSLRVRWSGWKKQSRHCPDRIVRMIRRALPILLLACCSACFTWAASYRFAAVWDGEKKIPNGCVTTQGDKIQSVGACPAGAIDMSKYTAIPG